MTLLSESAATPTSARSATTFLQPSPLVAAPTLPPVPVLAPPAPPPSEPDSVSSAQPSRRRPRRRLWRLLRRVAAVLCVFVLTLVAAVASLRVVDPPTTRFMADDPYVPAYQFVPLGDIGVNLAEVAVVHEDPAGTPRERHVIVDGTDKGSYFRPGTDGFLRRSGGTDWRRLLVRGQQQRRFGVDVGGSTTLQQQTIKNLVLTPARTPLRKVLLEPVLAEVFGYVVPKRRQLEIYLNIAEFAPGVWGACAASWYYFRKPPHQLSMGEATDLIAVLPMPKYFRSARAGGVVPLKGPSVKYSPKRLLAYARRNVPPQVQREHTVLQMRKAGIDVGAPTGACDTMPKSVRDILIYGQRRRDQRT